MKKYLLLITLLCITLLGAVFRVYQFSSVPNGLNRDEMALGYNSFSLLKTGLDEWGHKWPIVFRSFGDFKLGGYIYAMLPIVATFGLNAVVVRLPSLLAGLALPFVVFFFIHTLTKDKKFGVLAALVVALSPWSIFYSRVGFEANLALTVFLLGLTLFLKSFKSWKYLVLSMVCLFASFLTYNSPLLLAMFLSVAFLLLYKKSAMRAVVSLLFIITVAFTILLPVIKGKSTVTVFSDPGIRDGAVKLYTEAGDNSVQRVLANPYIFTSFEIVKRYTVSFSPVYLIKIGGENPWHQAPGSGHLTWSILALAIIGMVISLHRRKKEDLLLLMLLVASPLPSAITVDAPHATRMLMFFLMIGVFAGQGLYVLWRKQRLLGLGLVVILLIETTLYLNHYRAVLTKPEQHYWNTGIEEALTKAEKMHGETGQQIVILGDIHYTYISALFFTSFNPNEFRKTVEYYGEDTIGLSQVKRFGYYWFVSGVLDVPENAIVIEQLNDPQGYSVTQK